MFYGFTYSYTIQFKIIRKGDPLGIVQEIKIHPAEKWYIFKSESVQENVTQNSQGLL